MTSPVSPTTTDQAEDFDLGEWFQRHSRTATIIGIVAALLVGGIWLYMASSRRKENFAAADLARARQTAESGNLPLAANDLSRLADRFRGTRAGDEAVVLLNQVRLLQGQRDVAVNALQEFVAGRHSSDTEASAYALLAGALEDQNKFREAGEAYRNAARNAQVDFLKAGYFLEAGRALAAAGDTTGAKEAYREVLTTYAELDQANEARVRMAEIGGEVPEPPAAKREDR